MPALSGHLFLSFYFLFCLEHDKNCEFLIGNQGNFDLSVIRILQELGEKYTNHKITVVLAYLPKQKLDYFNSERTLFPQCVEQFPYRFAINRRNKYMADESNSYIEHNFGGAYKAA